MNILCVGNARFRIAHLLHDKPYLSGQVELWPWEPYLAGSADVDRIRRQLDRYLHILAEMTDSKLEVSLPDEPAALANIAASVLQVELSEKQRLLTTPSIGATADRCGRFVAARIARLANCAGQPPVVPRRSLVFLPELREARRLLKACGFSGTMPRLCPRLLR